LISILAAIMRQEPHRSRDHFPIFSTMAFPSSSLVVT
jgi:hypothetical protein